jgi:tetrapyrrole methylase family protein/MazG family protein
MSGGVILLGLGPGEPGLLSKRAAQVLAEADEIYLRTERHPMRDALPPGLRVHTFDHLYEQAADFEEVYQGIVETILRLGRRPGGVVYAVPGDPMVGEATVQALLARLAAEGTPCEIVHGVSFVEPCLALIGLDFLDGLYVADAMLLARRAHPSFPPDAHVLVGQLHSRHLASEVKLTLMNQYPEEHPIVLLHAAGTCKANKQDLPLFEMDRQESIGAMTTLYIPPMGSPCSFEAFQETVARLRAPNGCPWDREQTPQSLRPHLMGEAYETLQALDDDDMRALREELGDLLLQIVLQAQIATEGGEFSMTDVLGGINDKIVRRHPHVFGTLEAGDVDTVLHRWEELKAGERGDRELEGLLDGVPQALPALSQAQELQSRVARVGFDWPDLEGVRAKIAEELAEVERAKEPAEQAAEVGDVFFAVVNYARWMGVDAESALRQANRRFRRRFALLEQKARAAGRALKDMGIEELEALWQDAKKQS